MVGRIELICGCMFSGKTGRLIQELLAARQADCTVRAFKHRVDRRYDVCQLATHDGRRSEAEAVGSPEELLERGADVEVVGLDELHFFDRRMAEACETMRARGQRLIVVGLDHDSWGQTFPLVERLKEIADSVQIMRVPCVVCGAPARFSQRLVPLRGDDMVGGPGEYEPRCARCFKPLSSPAPEY